MGENNRFREIGQSAARCQSEFSSKAQRVALFRHNDPLKPVFEDEEEDEEEEQEEDEGLPVIARRYRRHLPVVDYIRQLPNGRLSP